MAGAKVMMIDDEPINMDMLQLHLAAEGYRRFVTLSDSTQALALIKAEHPSVLLLDLIMPSISGFDILKMVRADYDLKHLPIIVLTLARLREFGVQISIDDFGTGYSSLSYLQRFPVDQLKIDRSFVMQIESAHAMAPIVKAIVSLAHDLRLSVVAEGVEENVQLDYIRLLGCEEFQGYLYSRPVSVSDFQRLLFDDQRKCA